MSASGKVAIVEIVAPDGTVATLVEISLDGETLTISDKEHNITATIHELTKQLVNEVRSNYGSNTNS